LDIADPIHRPAGDQLPGAILSDHAAVTKIPGGGTSGRLPKRQRLYPFSHAGKQPAVKGCDGRGIVLNVAKKLKKNAKTQRQKWGGLLNYRGNRIHFQAPTRELSPEYAVRLVAARPVENVNVEKYNIQFLESLFTGPQCNTPGMLTNLKKHAVYDYS
jgi:hypothetical protein